MSRNQVKLHGDESRFEITAKFVYDTFGSSVKYIADVAGGQGMLSRLLNKKYNYSSEVIDPRGFTLRGVPSRQSEFSPSMAGFYDLVIGLHPDEATRAVAECAGKVPTLLVPCCNFWDRENKLGSKELVDAICGYYASLGISYRLETLPFKGPKNVAIITSPKKK